MDRTLHDILQNGSVGEQIETLEDHRQLAPNPRQRRRRNRFSVHDDAAAVVDFQAIDASQ
jgi:hypothetical protein